MIRVSKSAVIATVLTSMVCPLTVNAETLVKEATECAPFGAALQMHSGPKIGLALGGGGTRGAAHVGVLKVLKREGIPIDWLTGCSIGAIIGGMYCTGTPIAAIEEKLRKKEISRAYAPFYVRNGALRIIPLTIALLTNQPGMASTNRLTNYLERELRGAVLEDCNPKFAAVATELLSGDSCVLGKGSMATAIATSAALPPILKPVRTEFGHLMDGGPSCNLPAVAARRLGADVVIGVTVNQTVKPVKEKKVGTIHGVTDRMTVIAASQIDMFHSQACDVAILPDCSDIAIFSNKASDYDKAIRAGELAAEAAIPKIKELIQKKEQEIRSALNREHQPSSRIGTVNAIPAQ